MILRIFTWTIGLAFVALASVGGYYFYSVRALDVIQLTDDLYMLKGRIGGNVAVLRTTEGTVIVDTLMFPTQAETLREKVADLTGQPIIMIINTHWHPDHTNGNPSFDAGIRVVSTEKTLEHLKPYAAQVWEDGTTTNLPNETFATERELSVGGKTLRLIHPGRGHTDGDLVVQFVDENVIHAGDLVVHGHYPNIDLRRGGTIQGWSATLDNVLALPFDSVIPGHGTMTDRGGIIQFQTFLDELAAVGRDAAANDQTLDEAIATANLTADAGYAPMSFMFRTRFDRDFVIMRAWEEATGKTVAPDS